MRGEGAYAWVMPASVQIDQRMCERSFHPTLVHQAALYSLLLDQCSAANIQVHGPLRTVTYKANGAAVLVVFARGW